MGIFSKKINSAEFETLYKTITMLSGDLEHLKQQMNAVTTNMNSLRGLINRKLGTSDEIETNLNPDGLDELRRFGKHG